MDNVPADITPEGVVKAAEKGSGKILDPRPKLQLSGDGRLTSEVATELGQVLAPYAIYKYQEEAHIGDARAKILSPIKAAKFRTLIEDYIIPVKMQDGGEVVKTMTSGEAGTVLVSKHFLDQVREVERVNTVRLPVRRYVKAGLLTPVRITTRTVRFRAEQIQQLAG